MILESLIVIISSAIPLSVSFILAGLGEISILGQKQDSTDFKEKSRKKMSSLFDWQVIADQYRLLLQHATRHDETK